jgi:hypothetical protein
MKFLNFFLLESEVEIMPETRSESNSESNKKKLVHTLVCFFMQKNRWYTKTVLIKFMSNLTAHMIIKRLFFISVNP